VLQHIGPVACGGGERPGGRDAALPAQPRQRQVAVPVDQAAAGLAELAADRAMRPGQAI
jgi:hypothetical protein